MSIDLALDKYYNIKVNHVRNVIDPFGVCRKLTEGLIKLRLTCGLILPALCMRRKHQQVSVKFGVYIYAIRMLTARDRI